VQSTGGKRESEGERAKGWEGERKKKENTIETGSGGTLGTARHWRNATIEPLPRLIVFTEKICITPSLECCEVRSRIERRR